MIGDGLAELAEERPHLAKELAMMADRMQVRLVGCWWGVCLIHHDPPHIHVVQYI